MTRLLTLLLAVLLAATARGDPLTLAVEDNYAPFVDAGLPGEGLAVEIVAEVFRRAELPFGLVRMPWKRAYEAARDGTVFATFPWGGTPERRAEFLLSEPLYAIRDRFYARPDTSFRIERDEDLVGRTLCRPLSYSVFHREPQVQAGEIRRETPADMARCFRMLAAGRVELVWSEPSEALAAAAAAGLVRDKLRRQPLVAAEYDAHIMVGRHWAGAAETLAKLDEAIRALRSEGWIDRLYESRIAEYEARYRR